MRSASRSFQPSRAAVAVLTVAVFLTPLGTPAICARQHAAAPEAAQQPPCHGGDDAATQAPGHGTIASQPVPGHDCADMPWCGVVPMAPLGDLQHPVPEIPERWESGTPLVVTALQASVSTDPPPPRA